MKRPKQPKAKKHYLNKTYDDFLLWIDYWYQKKLIDETQPKTILEIGKGTGMLEAIMEKAGYQYSTLDIDRTLKPDIVGDVIKMPIRSESFDTVCAFQVLEHLQFGEFGNAIREMARVSKKSIIISLPYASIFFSLGFQISYAKKFSKLFEFLKIKPFEPTYFNISIPLFFLKKQGMIKAHAWEMGRQGFPVRRIVEEIEKQGLKVVKQTDRIFYPYHRFFVIKKLK